MYFHIDGEISEIPWPKKKQGLLILLVIAIWGTACGISLGNVLYCQTYEINGMGKKQRTEVWYQNYTELLKIFQMEGQTN